MIKRILFVLLLAFFSVNSFAQSSKDRVQPIQYNQNTFMTVFVNAKGKIFVDGKRTNIKKVPQLLTELIQKKGFIKFSSAQVNKEAVAKTNSDFFKLTRNKGLTVRVYTDKTFQKEVLL